MHYIEITENKINYKYSLSKIYYKLNTIYYYCSDIHCSGRIKVKFYFNLKENNIENFKIKETELSEKHNLEIIDHNYYVNKKIKDDL